MTPATAHRIDSSDTLGRVTRSDVAGGSEEVPSGAGASLYRLPAALTRKIYGQSDMSSVIISVNIGTPTDLEHRTILVADTSQSTRGLREVMEIIERAAKDVFRTSLKDVEVQSLPPASDVACLVRVRVSHGDRAHFRRMRERFQRRYSSLLSPSELELVGVTLHRISD